MTPDTRASKNSLAFLDHIATASGATLRPPGYLSLQMVEILGLTFGKGKEAIAGLSKTAMRDQLNAYFFCQAAPMPEVSRAIRRFSNAVDADPAARDVAWDVFMAESVDPFLFALTPAVEAEMNEQIEQLGDVVAAQVVAEPPLTPGPVQRERHDPNS